MTTVRPSSQSAGRSPERACDDHYPHHQSWVRKADTMEGFHFPWPRCARSLMTCVPAASPRSHKSLPVASLDCTVACAKFPSWFQRLARESK
jgi:hypothetical protein